MDAGALSRKVVPRRLRYGVSFGNLKSFPGSSMCSHGWEPLFYVASTTVFLKKKTNTSVPVTSASRPVQTFSLPPN